jgi:hypothetical protein
MAQTAKNKMMVNKARRAREFIGGTDLRTGNCKSGSIAVSPGLSRNPPRVAGLCLEEINVAQKIDLTLGTVPDSGKVIGIGNPL